MRLRMLVAYSMSSTNVATTRSYLNALSEHIDFDVEYIHVTHGAILNISPDEYDVVFHNYCARLCYSDYISESYRDFLEKFEGLKIAAIQDEYDFTNTTKENLKKLGFHVVLTCVPQDQLEYVYPQKEFPGVKFVTVLTGYVPDEGLVGRKAIPLAERPINVGYRGNTLPARYGRLGFEKLEVGRRVKLACEKRDISHDIAMDDASRIYGEKWFEFIASCRAVLGAESGCNAFDFDGTLDRTLKALEAEKKRAVTYDEFAPYIGDREDKISMGQISPRIFEAAAMHTPMILLKGRYSGLVHPEVHYIPLEKDYSNIDDVLDRLSDLPALERMAERAYSDLVASGKYTYSAYGKFLQDLIAESYKEHFGNASRARKELGDNAVCSFSPGESIEAVLNVQHPSSAPMGPARLNWAYFRAGSIRLRKEIDRLWSAFDDLCGQVLPWSKKTSKSYNYRRRFLTQSQQRAYGATSLPTNLSVAPMLDVIAEASRYRKILAHELTDLDGSIPDSSAVEKAAVQEEERFGRYQEYIARIVSFIEGLQREYDQFHQIAGPSSAELDRILSSGVSLYWPIVMIRRVKHGLVRRWLAIKGRLTG